MSHTTAIQAARGRMENSFDGNHADVELTYENGPNDPTRADAHDPTLPIWVHFMARPSTEELVGISVSNCTQFRGLIAIEVSVRPGSGEFRLNSLGDEIITLFHAQPGDTWNNSVHFRRWTKTRVPAAVSEGWFRDLLLIDYEVNF